MSTAALSPRTHRLEFLDSCRGLAALCVVLYHFLNTRTPLLHTLLDGVENLGAVGVYTFFFVSGFIIPVSLQRYPLPQFWRSRFFRLAPAYWFSIAIMLALGFSGFVALDPVFFTRNWSAYGLNLLMLPMMLHKPAILGVSWTLTIELIFYVLCSVLKATGLLSNRLITAYCAIGSFTLWRAVSWLGIGSKHLKAEWAVLIVVSFVGSVFYEIHTGRRNVRVLYPLLPAFLASAWLSIWFSVHAPDANPGLSASFANVVLTSLLSLGIFCVAFWMRARQFPTVLLWFGRISYSLYLMHGIIGLLVDHFLPARPYTWAVQLALALLAADLCYRFIERPTLRLAKGSHRNEITAPNAPILS